MSTQLTEPVDQVAAALLDTLNTEMPENRALTVVPVSRSSGLVIQSPEDRSVCSALLGDVKSKLAALDADRKDFTRPLDALKKKIIDRYRPAVEFWTGEKDAYERKLGVWDREQERIRLAKVDRVRREAEKVRQAEIAEAQRVHAGEMRKADELRKQADAEKDTERREQLRLEAIERENAADQESATRQEQAAMISTPVVAPAVAHIGGESQTWKYSAEEANLALLVKAVAEGRAPIAFLSFNQVGANRLANALQEEFRAQYPEATCGVRLVKTPVYSHRKARGK